MGTNSQVHKLSKNQGQEQRSEVTELWFTVTWVAAREVKAGLVEYCDPSTGSRGRRISACSGQLGLQ